MNYEYANNMLTGRNQHSKKIDNNTYLIRQETYIAVKLHDTEIIKYYPDNSIRLDSGGWKTNTTKDRITQYLPAYIYLRQRNGVWYVSIAREEYYFNDNMLIKNGETDALLVNEKEDKEKDKLRKNIGIFAKELVKRALDLSLPLPDSGDCWGCWFNNGDAMGNHHLIEHIKEKYYVPSLFWNAMLENRDRMSIMCQHVLGTIKAIKKGQSTEKKLDEWYISISQRHFTTYVKKYMFKRLGFTS